MTRREKNLLILAALAYFLFFRKGSASAASAPSVTNKTTTVDKGDGQGPQPLPAQPGRVKSIEVESAQGDKASATDLPEVPEGQTGIGPDSQAADKVEGLAEVEVLPLHRGRRRV